VISEPSFGGTFCRSHARISSYEQLPSFKSFNSLRLKSTSSATMFKLTRSGPLTAAFRSAKVCPPPLALVLQCEPIKNQQDTSRAPLLQQRRWLSIHEYLSANLLKTVRLLVGRGLGHWLTEHSTALEYPKALSPVRRLRLRLLPRRLVCYRF